MGAMVLVPAIGIRFAHAVAFLVLGAVVDEPAAKVSCWIVGAWIAYRALHMLTAPAQLTMRCMTTSPRFGLSAIKVVVNSFTCHSKLSEVQSAPLLRFASSLESTNVGVEVSGILVTPALVTQIAVGMVTHLPILVGLMQTLKRHVG